MGQGVNLGRLYPSQSLHISKILSDADGVFNIYQKGWVLDFAVIVATSDLLGTNFNVRIHHIHPVLYGSKNLRSLHAVSYWQ